MFHLMREREVSGLTKQLKQQAERRCVQVLACEPHHIVRHDEEGASIPMSCRFGLSENRLLAVCEEVGMVNIYRTGLERQRELLTPVRRWQAHRDAIFDVCWLAEDRRLLTASGDYHLCLWDTESMGLLSTFRGHVGSVKAIACQLSNNYLFASAGRDGNILMWDTRVAERSNEYGVAVKLPVMELPGAHSVRSPTAKRTPGGNVESAARSVTGLQFALDDSLLLSSGADGCIKYWDVRKVSAENPIGRAEPASIMSFEVKLDANQKRPHGLTSLTLSPCGRRLATSSLDNHVYEFDFYAPSEGAKQFNTPVSSFYAKVAYSPSGLHLVSGSSLPHVNVFDTSMPQCDGGIDPVQRLEGHSQGVFAVDWAPHDDQLASCSDDGSTRLWTVQPNRPQVKRRRAVEEIQPQVEDEPQLRRTRSRPSQPSIRSFFQPL